MTVPAARPQLVDPNWFQVLSFVRIFVMGMVRLRSYHLAGFLFGQHTVLFQKQMQPIPTQLYAVS